MTEHSKPEEAGTEKVECEGMGMRLEGGGAVEVALFPDGSRVSVRIIENDGKSTHFVLSSEAMDLICELYVDLVDPEADDDEDGADDAPRLDA